MEQDWTCCSTSKWRNGYELVHLKDGQTDRQTKADMGYKNVLEKSWNNNQHREIEKNTMFKGKLPSYAS